MISICIPVFNYAVDNLVKSLLEQIERSETSYEIYIAEDGSTDSSTLEINRSICYGKPLIKYDVLSQNLGRSAIRRYLAQHARFENLLFLDADMGMIDETFLKKYEILAGRSDVVCGGVSYRTAIDVPLDKRLHYLYGRYREEKVGHKENNKAISFLTCNFLIKRKVFLSLVFDAALRGYGHEDTFMLLQFKAGDYEVSFIDNPLYHEQLVPTKSFLRNQEQAIENLVYLFIKYRSKLPFEEVKLIRVYQKINEYFLGYLVIHFLTLTKMLWLELAKKCNSLFFMDLWKLSLFAALKNKQA